MVLHTVGVVNEVVDRPFDRLESDFLRYSGGNNPPGFVPHRGLIPARVLPVVGTHIEGIADRDGPNPRRGAIGYPVLTERRDVQVIGFSDLAAVRLSTKRPFVGSSLNLRTQQCFDCAALVHGAIALRHLVRGAGSGRRPCRG